MCNKIFSQILLFLVIYFAYGSSYLLRMPFGVIKDDILKHYDILPESLGYVDLAFLLPYALVSLTMGSAVEFLRPHLILSFSLMLSVLATCALPFCSSFVSFIMFIFILGGVQSLCWPTACALISSSLECSKSTIFGLFGTCCFLGSIIGKILAIEVRSVSWSMIFFVPSIVVGIMSCLVLASAKCFPKAEPKSCKLLPETVEKKLKTPSCWQMFMLPGVVEVSFTMFFVKSIRYMFMFWLPLYMNKALKYTPIDAGYASLSFDFGGLFGSCLIGFVSDKCAKGRDMRVCLLSVILCSFVVTAFYFMPDAGWAVHVALLVLVGSLNGGSDVLLCGSVATKLGRQYVASSTCAVSSLTGIVNGMGSVGTLLEGPIVSFFSVWFGWHSMLLVIIMFSIAASVCAVKANALVNQQYFI